MSKRDPSVVRPLHFVWGYFPLCSHSKNWALSWEVLIPILAKIFIYFRHKTVLDENEVIISGLSNANSRTGSGQTGRIERLTWLPSLFCSFITSRERLLWAEVCTGKCFRREPWFENRSFLASDRKCFCDNQRYGTCAPTKRDPWCEMFRKFYFNIIIHINYFQTVHVHKG